VEKKCRRRLRFNDGMIGSENEGRGNNPALIQANRPLHDFVCGTMGF